MQDKRRRDHLGRQAIVDASRDRPSGAALHQLAVAVVLVTVAACAPAARPSHSFEAQGRPSPRTPVLAPCPGAGAQSDLPAVKLSCLQDGPDVSTTKLGGRPVLINLWASWCGPCKQEMPALQAAYEQVGSRVMFLGVDTKDDPDSARDFLAATAIHYPQAVDADGQLLHELGGSGLPVTLILDASGNRVYSHRGELRADDLRTALAAAGVRP